MKTAHAIAYTHPEFYHHCIGNLGNPLKVVVCAGRDLAEDEPFGNTPADGHSHSIDECLTRVEVAFFGQVLRVAERSETARNDADFDHGVRVFKEPADDGMPRLVIGNDLAFLRRDQLVLLLQAANYAVNGCLEVVHFDGILVGTRSDQCRLVTYVCDLCPGTTRRLARQHIHLDVVGNREGARMDLKYFCPLMAIGLVDNDLTVETAGAQQRGIQHIGPVCGSHNNDALVGVEPVHLHEELVQGILTLVISTHDHPTAARPADGVDLVDKDDTGRLFLRLLEEVAHARRADADEHFDEV